MNGPPNTPVGTTAAPTPVLPMPRPPTSALLTPANTTPNQTPVNLIDLAAIDEALEARFWTPFIIDIIISMIQTFALLFIFPTSIAITIIFRLIVHYGQELLISLLLATIKGIYLALLVNMCVCSWLMEKLSELALNRCFLAFHCDSPFIWRRPQVVRWNTGVYFAALQHPRLIHLAVGLEYMFWTL